MTQVADVGNADDQEYDAYLARIQKRFDERTALGQEPLFQTNAAGLWEAYLDCFPGSERQYHNCNSCRSFIQRYGGLVVISDEGITTPALWDIDDAPAQYVSAVAQIEKIVRRAKVTGPFYSLEPTWGVPFNRSASGVLWSHLNISFICNHRTDGLQTPGQRMAEKIEDRKNIHRALAEFNPEIVAQAVQLLESDSLYRSEKVLGPAKFLAQLHAAKKTAKNFDNVVWKMVTCAPLGFCHPRASMIGTLLEDLAAGKSFDDVSRAFKSKMHPLQYQRPTASPSTGAIDAAEKIVEKLGIARSLERRFARIDEIQALWRPAPAKPPASGGVFAHLKNAATPSQLSVPPVKITFEKFSRTVLGFGELFLKVPDLGNFGALLTALHDDAPPIHQWDTIEQRNPFSWYLWHGGSRAQRWGLTAHSLVRVSAIAERPAHWFGRESPNHSRNVMFVLEGARESVNNTGNAIFPETLKSELHGVRSVIEAFSRKATIHGMLEASACGVILSAERPVHVVYRLNGISTAYLIDRMD